MGPRALSPQFSPGTCSGAACPECLALDCVRADDPILTAQEARLRSDRRLLLARPRCVPLGGLRGEDTAAPRDGACEKCGLVPVRGHSSFVIRHSVPVSLSLRHRDHPIHRTHREALATSEWPLDLESLHLRHWPQSEARGEL